MFTIKGCSLIGGVHYEKFHCKLHFLSICIIKNEFKKQTISDDRQTIPNIMLFHLSANIRFV